MMPNFNDISEGDGYIVDLPLSSEKDFYLKFVYLNTNRKRNSTYNQDLIFELSLAHKDKHNPKIDNIVDLIEFRSTLKCFIDKKMQVGEASRFFVLKEHNKIKSLKFILDEVEDEENNRYVSMKEAMQMYETLTYFISHYDLSYLYYEYSVNKFEFVSKKLAEKNKSYNRNTTILEFHDLSDPYQQRPDSLL